MHGTSKVCPAWPCFHSSLRGFMGEGMVPIIAWWGSDAGYMATSCSGHGLLSALYWQAWSCKWWQRRQYTTMNVEHVCRMYIIIGGRCDMVARDMSWQGWLQCTLVCVRMIWAAQLAGYVFGPRGACPSSLRMHVTVCVCVCGVSVSQ